MSREKRPPNQLAELERLREALRQAHTELYFAHTAVIELMPKLQQKILNTWTDVDERADLLKWEKWAVDRLLDSADKWHGPEMGAPIGEWRAICPLCSGEANTPYSRGFAIPIGLARHLSGSHGSRRCSVFNAAFELAMDRVRRHEDPTEPRRGMTGPFCTVRTKPWNETLPVSEPSPAAKVIELRPGKPSE